MLSGTFAVAEPGSGRIRLPLAFLQCNSTSYLQPVLVTCAIEGRLRVSVTGVINSVQQQSVIPAIFGCRPERKVPVHSIGSDISKCSQRVI